MARTEVPTLSASRFAQVRGRYVDQCGRRLDITRRPPHSPGLYDPAAPGTGPLQTDARGIERLLAFDSLTPYPDGKQ